MKQDSRFNGRFSSQRVFSTEARFLKFADSRDQNSLTTLLRAAPDPSSNTGRAGLPEQPNQTKQEAMAKGASG